MAIKKITKRLIFLPGLIALLIPIFNSLISYRNGVLNNRWISWIPNFIILFIVYLIRFYFINFKEQSLPVKKFISALFSAMNIGILATITIYFDFYLGALIYFLMHIFLIAAFISIYQLNLFFQKQFLLIKYSVIIAIGLSLILFIFFKFVYQDIFSLLFLPYVLILGMMFIICFLGLFQKTLQILFRLMIAAGALAFLISDLLIGLIPATGSRLLTYFVNPTYVLAIFLFTFSIFFGEIKKVN